MSRIRRQFSRSVALALTTAGVLRCGSDATSNPVLLDDGGVANAETSAPDGATDVSADVDDERAAADGARLDEGTDATQEGDTASADAAAPRTIVTNASDEARTGWYPDEPHLAPDVVGGASFGQLFSTAIDGQVYAQPLVADGTLFIATETNNLYALDAVTGAPRWTRNLGIAWNPTDVGCNDLTPAIGVTGTPVIDTRAHTAYLLSKTYASGNSGAAAWYMHAIDLVTSADLAGFPVLIEGTAGNDATQTFDAAHELARPGLLLLDGVVYAGFSAHCDRAPYQGFVVGVSTSGKMTALWTTEAGPNRSDGAGIWQSGGGILSDGPGQLLVSTGNGMGATVPTPGTSPPDTIGEAVVRLAVAADGSLKATDFFSPYNAADLTAQDVELGASGPMALPSAYFGTPSFPRLLVATGKEGYVYLLDEDHLGGFAMGPGGQDNVVARAGPDGGVWARPSVWPGDGGYVYIPSAAPGPANTGTYGNLHAYQYGVDDAGKPTLTLAATSADQFGFGSSATIVTSDGVRSGSALVWVVWAADRSGAGAELRAYDAVPAAGDFNLRFHAPIGQSAKFTLPGVQDGRIYVGTRDGHVLGFGVP